MNSSVTCASAIWVMSSWCLVISPSRRSNGPLKLSRWTWNVVVRSTASPPVGAAAGPWRATAGAAVRAPSSGDVATGDELSGQLPVRRRAGVGRRVRGDRLRGDGRVRELHRPADDRLQERV